MNTSRLLQIRQLDTTLETFSSAKDVRPPARGWAYEIRIALGMTRKQMGKRIGKDQSTVSILEKSEAARKITMGSLQDLAEALDCQLVYAIVPKSTGLQVMLRSKLEAYARKRVMSVSRTMVLEDQGVSESFVERQVSDLVEEWIRRPPKNLWDVVGKA